MLFNGIAMQEVPCNRGTHDGYFTHSMFSEEWTHTERVGAGVWHIVTDENFFFYDMAAAFGPYPKMTDNGVVTESATGWQNGTMTWEIPIGWADCEVKENGGVYVKLLPCEYEQQFIIDWNGKVGVRKFFNQVMRDTNDTIRLNAKIVKSGGVEVRTSQIGEVK